MYILVHTYIQTHIHTHIHTYIHTHICIYIHTTYVALYLYSIHAQTHRFHTHTHTHTLTNEHGRWMRAFPTTPISEVRSTNFLSAVFAVPSGFGIPIHTHTTARNGN